MNYTTNSKQQKKPGHHRTNTGDNITNPYRRVQGVSGSVNVAKHHPKPPAQVTASHRLPKLIYDAEDPNSHPNQIHAASNPESETELEFSEKE